MKKKVLFYAMTIVLSLVMMPKVFAASGTQVTTITPGGNVSGDVNTATGNIIVTFDATTLKIEPAQDAGDHLEARPAGSAWLGIKVTAPDDVSNDATYYAVNTLGKKSVTKNFSEFKDSADGKDISLWSGVNFEVLKFAITNDKDVTMEYHFDWDANGDYEQIVKVVIAPENVTLQNQTGSQAYPLTGTLGEITSIFPESAKVTGSKDNFVEIVYPNVFELEWVEKDQDDIHRPKDGWWIGIKVSKEGSTNSAKFRYRVNGGDYSLPYTYDDEKEEGQDYVTIWALINEEKIEGVDEVVYEYEFDWDGDGEYEQIVTQRIPVKNIVLTKEGETIYPAKPSVDAPNTIDNVSKYLVIGLIALAGVVTFGYAYKRKLENR